MIEIYNPGTFPINLNPEMFVNERRKSIPRNKVILNTLYKCKAVEVFRSGLKRVYNSCKKVNINLDYKLYDEGFSFIFYRKNVTLNNELKLSNTDLKVLKKLKESPIYTRDELAKELGLTIRTIQRSINKLVSSEKIVRIGSRKSQYWKIIDD